MNIDIEAKIQELTYQRNMIDNQINMLRSLMMPSTPYQPQFPQPQAIGGPVPAPYIYPQQQGLYPAPQVPHEIPTFRQDALELQKANQVPPDQVQIKQGTYFGKPTRYVEEHIGSKPKDYYDKKDKEIK